MRLVKLKVWFFSYNKMNGGGLNFLFFPICWFFMLFGTEIVL